jgi:hypothetical protein
VPELPGPKWGRGPATSALFEPSIALGVRCLCRCGRLRFVGHVEQQWDKKSPNSAANDLHLLDSTLPNSETWLRKLDQRIDPSGNACNDAYFISRFTAATS